MNWKEFVASIISSTAWPISIFAISFLFKNQIQKLFNRLKNFEHGGTKFAFTEGLSELENQGVSLSSPTDKVSFEEMAKLAEKYPHLVIIEAWKPIESEIQNLAKTSNLSETNKHVPYRSVLRYLSSKEKIPVTLVHQIEEISRLRNLAVHDIDHSISSGQALSYFDIAQGILARLKAIEL